MSLMIQYIPLFRRRELTIIILISADTAQNVTKSDLLNLISWLKGVPTHVYILQTILLNSLPNTI